MHEKGLTLLEVLVALVILAIALTAVIKATTENIRSTAYLQEKTLATWVALKTLNQAKLGLINLPGYPEHRDGNEIMLNQSWEWHGFIKSTPNAFIQEIHVQVFHLPDHRRMTEMVGYFYVG